MKEIIKIRAEISEIEYRLRMKKLTVRAKTTPFAEWNRNSSGGNGV